MTTMTATEMACPKCGGPCWNNVRENDARIANGEKARPDFKCKNRACDGAIWRPKNGNGRPPVQAQTPQPISYGDPLPGEYPPQPLSAPQAPPRTTVVPATTRNAKLDAILAVHGLAFEYAKTLVNTEDARAAVAATILIAAQKDGLV